MQNLECEAASMRLHSVAELLKSDKSHFQVYTKGGEGERRV